MQKPSREFERLMLKRLERPNVFQGEGFKGKVRERVSGCLIGLFTFLSLVDDEVTGSG